MSDVPIAMATEKGAISSEISFESEVTVGASPIVDEHSVRTHLHKSISPYNNKLIDLTDELEEEDSDNSQFEYETPPESLSDDKENLPFLEGEEQYDFEIHQNKQRKEENLAEDEKSGDIVIPDVPSLMKALGSSSLGGSDNEATPIIHDVILSDIIPMPTAPPPTLHHVVPDNKSNLLWDKIDTFLDESEGNVQQDSKEDVIEPHPQNIVSHTGDVSSIDSQKVTNVDSQEQDEALIEPRPQSQDVVPIQLYSQKQDEVHVDPHSQQQNQDVQLYQQEQVEVHIEPQGQEDITSSLNVVPSELHLQETMYPLDLLEDKSIVDPPLQENVSSIHVFPPEYLKDSAHPSDPQFLSLHPQEDSPIEPHLHDDVPAPPIEPQDIPVLTTSLTMPHSYDTSFPTIGPYLYEDTPVSLPITSPIEPHLYNDTQVLPLMSYDKSISTSPPIVPHPHDDIPSPIVLYQHEHESLFETHAHEIVFEKLNAPPTVDVSVQASVLLSDIGVNTDLKAYEFWEHVNETQKSVAKEERYQQVLSELNEEKSQRMVNDHLVKILQSDVTDLQQRNVAEATTRLRLESEIADLKAELTHSQDVIKEKEQRVTELEDSLNGTMLLVRKLEEQSATIVNKGGVDYLLQAKIADGRAQEAEQKLEVLQAELLQSQAEVKHLLDRMGGFSRERQEMVSGRVHNQLLQLSDERAERAERRIKELEQEILQLKTGSNRSSLPSPYPSYSSFDPFSSSSLFSSHTPFSYTPTTTPISTYGSSYSTYGQDIHDIGSSTYGKPSYSSAMGLGDIPRSSSTFVPSYMGSSTLSNPEPIAVSDNETSFAAFLQNENSRDKWIHDETKQEKEEKQDTPPSIPLLPLLPSVSPTSPTQPIPEGDTKSDSSDWSSSEEDDDHESSLRPSAHMNLRSKFEWLSQQQTSSLEETFTTPSKKPPPPVAPKPKFRHFTSGETIQAEPPISFDQPTQAPSLHTYAKPPGPRGRRLPSKIFSYFQST